MLKVKLIFFVFLLGHKTYKADDLPPPITYEFLNIYAMRPNWAYLTTEEIEKRGPFYLGDGDEGGGCELFQFLRLSGDKGCNEKTAP